MGEPSTDHARLPSASVRSRDPQRAHERLLVAHGRLVRLGRHHVHVADGLERLLEREQSTRLDAVVVGDEDARAGSSTPARGFGSWMRAGSVRATRRPPPAARPGRGRWRDRSSRSPSRRPSPPGALRPGTRPCCPLGWLASPFRGLSSLIGWSVPVAPLRSGPARRWVCPGCRSRRLPTRIAGRPGRPARRPVPSARAPGGRPSPPGGAPRGSPRPVARPRAIARGSRRRTTEMTAATGMAKIAPTTPCSLEPDEHGHEHHHRVDAHGVGHHPGLDDVHDHEPARRP